MRIKKAEQQKISILSTDNNTKGDLLTKLTADLFFALGYESLRQNIHKSGRELDITGIHRFETRSFVAECKAHKKKMGGDELNKFLGVLTRERSSNPNTEGYFISISGFTETAIQQEEDSKNNKLILIDNHRLLEELQRANVIINYAQACIMGQETLSKNNLVDLKISDAGVVIHEVGYIWWIRYHQGKLNKAFILIHADGTILSPKIASEIIELDATSENIFKDLDLLPSPTQLEKRVEQKEAALNRYKAWLLEECGHIQLDGLPADTELSAARIKLEKIFIPARAIIDQANETHPEPEAIAENSIDDDIDFESEFEHSNSIAVGQLLTNNKRIALLASPGGGKSTLLKRIAVAYAFRDRLKDAKDELPENNWLPLFIRCRELKDRAYKPIFEILESLGDMAGLNSDESSALKEELHYAINDGKALILLDGLDEISEETARQVFSSHLRTFVGMYPSATIVITSRIAGFRTVAGAIASSCSIFNLASLSRDEVTELCENWSREVIGNKRINSDDTERLTEEIFGNRRIRALAKNPLLLTTLLVVKRWIGALPKGRVALYREAVRVLIRTWNVEGYEPLDEEEALAQLSYVACSMSINGVQQITYRDLLKELSKSRKELEAELQFTKISPKEFVDRIEYRSSLLMQTGMTLDSGELQPVYEFRHLTFQEYLTARGYIEEQYPGRNQGTPYDTLIKNIPNPRWKEIISIASVLSGRKAENLLKPLIDTCNSSPNIPLEEANPPLDTLIQTLLDEVVISPSTLKEALTIAAINDISDKHTANLLTGKYGETFKSLCLDIFFTGGKNWSQCARSVTMIFTGETTTPSPKELNISLLIKIKDLLASKEKIDTCTALALLMITAFNSKRVHHNETEIAPAIVKLIDEIYIDTLNCTYSEAKQVRLLACWALSWMGSSIEFSRTTSPASMAQLVNTWMSADEPEYRRFCGWAIDTQPLLDRDCLPLTATKELERFLKERMESEESLESTTCVTAAAKICWYLRSPFNDKKLYSILKKATNGFKSRKSTTPSTQKLIAALNKSLKP